MSENKNGLIVDDLLLISNVLGEKVTKENVNTCKEWLQAAVLEPIWVNDDGSIDCDFIERLNLIVAKLRNM